MQFTISEPYHSTSIEREESCYSFHFYQFSRSFQHRTKDLSCQCFPLSHHSRCDTSISFSPVSSLRHPVTQKQKARSKNSPLLPPRSPQFFSHCLPCSSLPVPLRSSPSRRHPPPLAAPFLSSDFPHSIFAISTSDIGNSPERKCRLIVPSVTLLGPSSLSLSCPRVTFLLTSLLLTFSTNSSFPSLLSAVELSLSAGFRARKRRDSCARIQSGSIHRFALGEVRD